MSWKSLQQQSLTHGMLVDHEALHELDEVDALIDWSLITDLLRGVHNNPKGEQACPSPPPIDAQGIIATGLV